METNYAEIKKWVDDYIDLYNELKEKEKCQGISIYGLTASNRLLVEGYPDSTKDTMETLSKALGVEYRLNSSTIDGCRVLLYREIEYRGYTLYTLNDVTNKLGDLL